MTRVCKVTFKEAGEELHVEMGHCRKSAEKEAERWCAAHPSRSAEITEEELGDWESRITRYLLPDEGTP